MVEVRTVSDGVMVVALFFKDALVVAGTDKRKIRKVVRKNMP